MARGVVIGEKFAAVLTFEGGRHYLFSTVGTSRQLRFHS